MKHECVAARMGAGKALVAANVENLCKTSNAAGADSGCNPLWAGTSLARRPPAHGERSCGAETGAMRRRRFSSSGAWAPFPQAGLRLTSLGASLSQVTGLEWLSGVPCFAFRAKLVTAHTRFIMLRTLRH